MGTLTKKVREGYKDTEVGEVPIEWEVGKLGDLGETIIGLTYKPDNLVEKGQGTLVLRSSNIKENALSFSDNKYVNLKIPTKLLVKENDILICSRNGSKELIGKSALIRKEDENMTFGAFMTVYRSSINSYLYHCFKTNLFKKQINANLGATINQVTTKNLNSFKFPIPPLKEQQKIVEILSTLDEQIENMKQLMSEMEVLKTGLMYQLLTRGIDHTEFAQTILGELPADWEINKLGDNGDLLGGFAFKSKDFLNAQVIDSYQVLKMGNVKMGRLDLLKSPAFISKAVVSNKHEKYFLFKGDILISLTGTVGKKDYGNVAIVDQDNQYLLNQRVACFRPVKGKKLRSFYFYYMQSRLFRDAFFQLGLGGTGNQTNVSVKDLGNIYVASPPIEEQQKIADILSTIDEQIESYEQEKENYIELKKGLMQQLLTGKLRVTV
jgi:type I restriction enzyme S subunit